MSIKKILLSGAAGAAIALAAFAVPVFADSIPTIDFEGYTLGNINGQNGWMKTGPYDSVVADVSAFTNANSFGFGTKSLRISNAVTSGAFGDQTFSPGLVNPAGESTGNNHFEASFSIGSTQGVQQPGLFLSVSPDDGSGSRMSYAGFDDQSDGVHVIFYDVTDAGPLGTVANFNSHDVSTIDRTSAHSIKFVMDFVPGPANDVVKLYVDNVLKYTGTSWEDYYRYDPEQIGNGNVVPTTSKLLFRVGGTAAPATNGNGYLVDNVSLLSSVISQPKPDYKEQCKKDGWSQFYFPQFKNQGSCVSFFENGKSGFFKSSNVLYYNGATNTAPLYGTGSIGFAWDKKTGKVTGGYYNEVVPPTTGTTYYNVVTGGTVSGNAVTLTFTRTVPNTYGPFTFNGTLTDNELSGQLDGPYLLTATGN